jgi:hypothetical protein
VNTRIALVCFIGYVRESRNPKLNIQEPGRDGALRRSRPHGAGGTNREGIIARQPSFRRLTLRSATETAQRAISTNFGVRVKPASAGTEWLLA